MASSSTAPPSVSGQTSRANPASTPSQSQTITGPRNQNTPVLRLRGAHTELSNSENRRIQWDASVIDNEGLGKKSSKVCCIYHAPRDFGESSDESSSDEDGSDESQDDGIAKAPRRKGCQHGPGHNHGKIGKGGNGKRERSPNAYEKIPKPRRVSNEKEKS